MAKTIGEQLRQAREQRGLTLEQAAEETRIRVHFLEALENDQRDALPSTVQGRGFLRLYAGMLDLPVAPLLAQWDGSLATGSTAESTGPTGSSPLPEGAPDREQAPENGSAPQVETLAEPDTAPEEAPEIEDGSVGPAQAYPLPEPETLAPESSQAIFVEIGEKLRAQRESLGLTLAEAERYTKLRLRYIQALEAGKLDDLPSPVQGRGMLSNYASFLNMDEGRLLLRFADGLQARRVERQPKVPSQSFFAQKRRPARPATMWRRFMTPDLMFGIAVAAIILAFALWAASRINVLRTAEEEPTPPGIAEILLTPDEVTTTPGTGTPGTGTPGANNVVAGESNEDASTPEPPAEGETTGGEAVVGVPVLPSPPGQATPQETPTIRPINNDPLQVYIISRQRAYLKVVTDDRVRFLGRTVPGNAYAFSANNRIELSTGNSAALQVYFNQTDLGTLGIAGEVTNLVFTDEGIATPTAAFTSTPTATRQATITPLPSATPTVTPTITPLIP